MTLVSDTIVEFVETYLRVPEGRAVGDPMVLMDWQKEWLRDVFDNPRGTRRAILSVGRKNAKSTLVAALLLAYLVGPLAVRNGQVYSAAQSREQAALIFALMAKMVRMSPDLAAHVVIRDSGKEMLCTLTGVRFRALSADAATAMGTSPVAFVFDEAGQVRGPECALFDALHSGQGAHAAPIEFIISTQAAADTDFLSLMIDDAQRSGDPHTVCRVYAAPRDCDLMDEAAWRAANPALGTFITVDYVRQLAEEAQRMPSRESQFRNLILNSRCEATTHFVSPTVWQENGAQPSPLDGAKVWGGLDLASVHDLTALVLVAEDGSVHCFAWLPAEGLAERARHDRAEYQDWARKGLLHTTPGRATNYDYVATFMRSLFNRCKVEAIAFDRAFMRFLKPCLERAGFSEAELARFVEHGQGFLGMAPAIRELEVRLLECRLKHGNHPVLTMCAANAVVVLDPANNRKFEKRRSNGRIDAMVALAMAVGVQPMAPAKAAAPSLHFL